MDKSYERFGARHTRKHSVGEKYLPVVMTVIFAEKDSKGEECIIASAGAAKANPTASPAKDRRAVLQLVM